MSKRKIGAVALLMAAIVVVSAVVTAFTGVSHRQSEGRLQVVASFYPVYVAALNVTDGVEDISLQSLAGPQTGCLHDYQLSPDNQMTLEKADVLLLSGAGAESFLDDALTALPDLAVVDMAQGIDLLESDHAHEDTHQEALYNEHIWTSPSRYARQVQNLCDGLCRIDPDNAAAYRANANRYIREINAVGEQLQHMADSAEQVDGVIFHESLAYLAQDMGLRVVVEIPMGEDESISAATLAAAEHAIRADRPLWLLYDSQYPTDDYDYLGQKGASSYKLTMDTGVTGREDKDAWLTAMRANLVQLRAAWEEAS